MNNFWIWKLVQNKIGTSCDKWSSYLSISCNSWNLEWSIYMCLQWFQYPCHCRSWGHKHLFGISENKYLSSKSRVVTIINELLMPLLLVKGNRILGWTFPIHKNSSVLPRNSRLNHIYRANTLYIFPIGRYWHLNFYKTI